LLGLAEIGRAFSSRFLSALQYSDYRRLWAATAFSQSSAWALIIARAALALNETGSSSAAGVVTFAAMIPSVVMSPVAGYLADRFDRRRVLAFAYSVNVGQNLILAVLVVTGSIELWHLVLLSLINGSARATQMPASQALLPNLIPRNRLLNGVALHQATQQGGKLMGPLLILPVVLTGHSDWAFVVSSGLYIVGLALVLRIRTVSRGEVDRERSALSNLGQGLSFVYRHHILLPLFLLVVVHCALTMSYETLFPVLSRDRLGLQEGADLYKGGSLLMIGIGAGSLLSSFGLAGIESNWMRGRTFFVLGVLSGVSPLVMGLSTSLPMAVGAAFGVGLSQAGFMTLSSVMVQQMVPDHIRGRVMAVYSWHIQGFMASFNLVNGILADTAWLNATRILGGMGSIFTGVMFLSIVRVPLRQIYNRGVSPEATSTVST
jgi:MFS family permease